MVSLETLQTNTINVFVISGYLFFVLMLYVTKPLGFFHAFATGGPYNCEWKSTAALLLFEYHFDLYLLYFFLDSPYQYAAHFSDDGYIALPKSVFPRR